MPSSDQPLTLKPFTTERLHCRLVELRDLNEIFAMYSREDVTRYLPYDTWQSHHHAKEWWHKTQKRHNSGEARQYAVQLNANGSVIGSIILFGFTAEPCAELGYSLHSDYWGQGLMQEVLAELIFRCHSELKLKRMIARVAPSNLASQKLLARLGFEEIDRCFENNEPEHVIELVNFEKLLL